MPQLRAGFAALCILALASCGPGKTARVSYRDAALQVYSNAAFDPARLQGDWVQIAGFQRAGTGGCAGGVTRFGTPDATGRIPVQTELCLSGKEMRFAGTADPAGPGRLALVGADPQGIGQVWWILWADIDTRTLVIGTPSGDFGFILNRGADISQDRLAAARDVLDFNGYDTTRLRVF